MLVGGAMGGKTISWKALQIALTNQAAEGEGLPVHTEVLNPKAITISELYGSFNPITSEWSDGVLSKSIRECSFSEQTSLKWIIVDGPVDSLWIESMNSLLDDNKVLCLANNERIQLGPHVKMVFEVDNLDEASPATVSRCGMIYFDPSQLPWNSLVESWADQYKDDEKYKDVIEFIKSQLEKYIPTMIQFILNDGKTAMQFNPNSSIVSILKILTCYMAIIRDAKQKMNEAGDEMVFYDPLDKDLFVSEFYEESSQSVPFFVPGDDMNLIFERIIAFSLVWCFGGVLEESSRSIFDNFLKELMTKNETKVPFPPNGTCFNFYCDLIRKQWTPWTDGKTGIKLDENNSLELNLFLIIIMHQFISFQSCL